jgi:heme/copper-type cytochrome/quinol oxidase subunit 1
MRAPDGHDDAHLHMDRAVHQRVDRRATFPVLIAARCSARPLRRNALLHQRARRQSDDVHQLIWIWGHPEVYILILPAFGIFSEVVAAFSGKRLFGYTSMVYATVVITILAYLVWLHHFFTMGSGASVNAFFGITTMIISIPTGAKIFNWLFTMYRGRIRFEIPMLWTIGFMVTFVIGGMTGVSWRCRWLIALLHNSLFLVAHFTT